MQEYSMFIPYSSNFILSDFKLKFEERLFDMYHKKIKLMLKDRNVFEKFQIFEIIFVTFKKF